MRSKIEIIHPVLNTNIRNRSLLISHQQWRHFRPSTLAAALKGTCYFVGISKIVWENICKSSNVTKIATE